ncbi:hypothetical protein QYE76_071510 [Lolium multiflorum]|uniref:RNase H type-1 domain-containing protein n=1 Tax=Lolium multiflorum TaxID=4521 RepID=A0AAD8WFG8_LOLMU|nr:hypothetical protein QYE76_071510 [Lolium multiflorum]
MCLSGGAHRHDVRRIPIWRQQGRILPSRSSDLVGIFSGRLQLFVDDEEFSSTYFVDNKASGKLAKIFSNTSFESSADSFISSDSDSVDSFNFIDKSAAIGKIRLKEEDEAKTAFITPYGVFCYKTMPFGLKNAGATYQRMMQKCLATQIGKNVQVYIDDVVITSKKGSTLIEDLKETFDNLDKFCLKLNPTKCSFGVPAGELLGVDGATKHGTPRFVEDLDHELRRVQEIGRCWSRRDISFTEGDKLKYVLRMTFPNASNNEAEYEALIHGMKMAKACGATRLKIFGDSQLVAQQVMNQCDAVNESMIAYKEVYNELEKLFDGCEVNHISRMSNDEADVLANIGSQCLAIPPGVFWEEISERSTKPAKTKKEKKEKTSTVTKGQQKKKKKSKN